MYLFYRSYWSKSWPFNSNNFASLMSSRRLELILRFIHLNDSATQPKRGEPGFDRLYKIRPLLNLFLESYKDSYIPTQNLSIDKSMISFKGRLSLLQYLPKKPHKWGMKAWVLADASNGYTWGWSLYTGKDIGCPERGLAHRVAMDLVDDRRLEGKGYVFTDNFYTSPALFRDLAEKGFGACGTARKDRRGIPISGRDTRLKWHDKRDVTMLSTYHDDRMVTKSRRSRAAEGGVEDIENPQVVEDYNQHMGGVDQSEKNMFSFVKPMHLHNYLPAGDQLLMYYGFPHRSVKWWKRVFFHLLDHSIVNSHILFKTATGSKMTLLEFRSSVATSLIDVWSVHVNTMWPVPPNSPYASLNGLSPSQSQTREELTAKYVVTEGWGNVTKRGIGASCVIQHCAYTPVLSDIIHSKIIRSSISHCII